ncbi:aminodeoxychorismate synthase component I [Oceanobacillus rekensis]|uniref:aminodeoxychorismate synthase component I n=1 Tax=Oceanobacillus rekensis TaxID=937927 RepID=UPI000B435D61|nr:aminodeoxychorismate synthase component I [Oceanobacillus rekensis]
MIPLLHFDFIDKDGKMNPLLFKKPTKIISTSLIEEVIPLLKQIEDETNNGYYAAGYISYEASPAFDQSFQVNPNPEMPLLWFGIFEKPEETSLQNFEAFSTSDWKAQTKVNEYNNNINRIKSFIEQGITYQVNYTIRMQSKFNGSTISYYNQLAQAQAANYSAYLNIGDYSIISASPELFFHLKENKITTKPMKGTIGRGKDKQEDQSNSDWLYQSEKNRAENAMIVDLLRNDLGTIANQGSVEVPSLYSIEEYPTVFQMTSTITGEISNDKTITDIFRSLFPCGSITGAPKISTMNIINNLESSPRDVYCGAIGYITPDREAIFNVPIRTTIINNKNGSARYGVGGGITWDSIDKEEYDEILVKAKILNVKPLEFDLLESLGLEDGSYLVLNNHLNRLRQTAEHFKYKVDFITIKDKLHAFANQHAEGKWKVRLLSSRNGDIYIEGKEIKAFTAPLQIELANIPVIKENVFLHHKTTNRSIYENILKHHPNVYDVLLWNEDKEITEFTTGNVVMEMNDKLYTPPLASGLLAGTYRKDLLEKGIILERKIVIDELSMVSRIWLINSVRKWVQVKFRKKP